MSQIVTLGLTSPYTLAAAPYTFGHPFKEGDVPAGMTVTADCLDFQCVVKNRWPDGSAKVTLISGYVKTEADSMVRLHLSTAPESEREPVPLSLVKAGGIKIDFDAGQFGSASLSAADWDAPLDQWVAGPVMSSWRYRKPFGNDDHLVGWAELRCYADGGTEFLAWVENNYLNVDGPTNKPATYTVTISDKLAFGMPLDFRAHTRSQLLEGEKLAYWHGIADPQIIPRHDGDYLSATRMLPAFYRKTPDSAPIMADLPESFTPFQRGSYRTGMGNGGFSHTLGIITGTDALCITNGSAKAYKALVRNAFSAGRYGIHYRDERTHRPIRYSDHPHLVLHSTSGGITAVAKSSKGIYTPAETGSSPHIWSNSHHPEVAYVAFLLTGWHYLLEEMYFAVTATYLKNQDTHRQFSKGIMLGNVGANEVRGMSWAIRSMSQAAAAAPDGDFVGEEIRAQVIANIEFNHAKYCAQPHNKFGFIKDYTDYGGADGKLTIACWQHHFGTAAFGHLKSLKVPMPKATEDKLSEFFAWKAQPAIGLLGGLGKDEFHYSRAGQYNLVIAPQDNAQTDFDTGTGPWLPSWGAIFEATLGEPNSGVPMDLVSSSGFWAGNYLSNLNPAISWAVEHGVPGAAESYQRMVSSPSWVLQEDSYANMPPWGIRPATMAAASENPAPTPVEPEPIKPAPAPTPPAPTPPQAQFLTISADEIADITDISQVYVVAIVGGVQKHISAKAFIDLARQSADAPAPIKYLVKEYGANRLRVTRDASGAGERGGFKYLLANSLQSNRWTVTPAPSSFLAGWGESSVTPPAEITAEQNAIGRHFNGLLPAKSGDLFWSSNAALHVPSGGGASTWFFWTKCGDSPAACLNAATPLVVSGA